MKTIFLLFLFPFSVCYGQTKKPVAKTKQIATKPAAAMTPTDSLSYSIGVQVAEYYKTMGVEKINTDYVAKAFHDVLNNKPLTILENECNMNKQKKIQQIMATKVSPVKEARKKILEENNE